MMINDPHDKLFKKIFSDPKLAAAEIRAVLPEEMREIIDFESMTLQPGSYVDRDLAGKHSDLLFRAKTRSGEALVYLLFEHQSRPDRFMALRMLAYVVRILERWRDENKEAKVLPVVVPIVVYHGKRRWRFPTEVAELFDAKSAESARKAGCLPRHDFILDSLRDTPTDALRRRDLPALAKLTLLSLQNVQRVRHDDAEAFIILTAGLFRTIAEGAGGRDDLVPLLVYILSVLRKMRHEDLSHLLREHVGPQVQESIMPTADQLREEGREEGRDEGSLSEARAILLKQLHLKFGAIPDGYRRMVDLADKKQLDRWIEGILTARSLDELF